jgi:hypothetical protein
MISYEISPHLISKMEQIMNHKIQIMGLLAEIAEDMREPVLNALITNIIGDENGHIRFFTLLLSLVGSNDNTIKSRE